MQTSTGLSQAQTSLSDMCYSSDDSVSTDTDTSTTSDDSASTDTNTSTSDENEYMYTDTVIDKFNDVGTDCKTGITYSNSR